MQASNTLNQDEIDKINKLCAHVGTKIDWNRSIGNEDIPMEYAYNGLTIAGKEYEYCGTIKKRIKIRNKTKVSFFREYVERHRTADMLVHEVAHYIVATPKRRKIPEFGLGTPEWWDTLTTQRITSVADSVYEEGVVQMLGIFLYKKIFGEYPPDDPFSHHSWDNFTLSKRKFFLKKAKKIYNYYFNPKNNKNI